MLFHKHLSAVCQNEHHETLTTAGISQPSCRQFQHNQMHFIPSFVGSSSDTKEINQRSR
jgi:hypothetical protein